MARGIKEQIEMARRICFPSLVVLRAIIVVTLAFLVLADVAEAQVMKIRVGWVPIAEQAPNFVAADKGIFNKHNLDVDLILFKSGPAVIAAQLGGSIDIGLVGTPGAIFAWASGKHLYAFADLATTADQKPYAYSAGVVTRKDSPMNDFGDLKGKRLGVNVLKSSGEIMASMIAQRWAAENPSRAVSMEKDVKLVVMPFPSLPAALEKGLVDAVVAWEPFATEIAMRTGLKVIAPSSYAVPGYPVGFWLVTKEVAEKQPRMVLAYRDAFYEAVDWIKNNDKEARTIIAKWTKVDPAVAERMALPTWEKDLNVLKARTKKVVDNMVAMRLVTDPVDLDRYFITTFAPGWERKLR